MGEEPLAETRKDMRRAIVRLSILEYVVLALTVVAALAGGALAAWLAESAFGAPFRSVWVISSVLLFVLPGIAVWGKELRGSSARSVRRDPEGESKGDDGGL